MDTIMSLDRPGLVHRCRKQQRLFIDGKPHDPRYCYELFRIALQNDDQIAWEHITKIFTPLVTSWVQKHVDFPNCEEEPQDIVQGAFIRFITALSGKKFDTSKNLAALLLYLKRCVHSEIVDILRRKAPITQTRTDNHSGIDYPQVDPIAVEKLWDFVKFKLKSDKEKIVVYATFFLAYKPSQIFTAYPKKFKSVRDIHRTKENVIARLRRDDGLKEYFDFDV